MTPQLHDDNDRRGPNHRSFGLFVFIVVPLLTMMVPVAARRKTRMDRSSRSR